MKSSFNFNSLFIQFSPWIFLICLDVPLLIPIVCFLFLYCIPRWKLIMMKVLSSCSFLHFDSFTRSLFLGIIFFNFIGLFPFFPPITQSIWTLMFMVSAFLSTTCLQIFFNFEDFMSHTTPLGTPTLLLFAINTIEGISIFARWITLSGRIIGNITCSHCLVTLLEMPQNFFVICIVLIIFHLEFMVCVIQGLVPYILIHSYYSEGNYKMDFIFVWKVL